MEKVPIFSNKSLASVPIEMLFSQSGSVLATGTAFFYKKEDLFYMITNWHNFTGINPQTKKPLGLHAGRPDKIRFPLFKHNNNVLSYHYFEIALYEDDNMENPLWFVHPNYLEEVDVVALQMSHRKDFRCMPINEVELGFKEFSPIVSDDVFVLGFPYNIRQNNMLPIWKRASIATEPELDYEGKPIILIDTASRPGMSGSPVILRRNSIWQDSIGVRQCFLGIYSGRLVGETDFEAQLGIVWKKCLIEEIIDAGKRDRIENFT